MRTLAIDIGGTGIKAIVLDAAGVPVTPRLRVATPRPAGPEPVLAVLDGVALALGAFDRISLGFPGVVREGVTWTAPHLDRSWAGVALERLLAARTGKPVRVLNDAAIHGLGVIEGRGLEAVITLGTGLGCCLYADGHPWQIELGHHPYRKGREYEATLGDRARKAAGNPKWNRRVRRALGTIEALLNYRRLYLGGGNARHLEREDLPENVTVIDNDAGLLGGIRLWT
jgi:polyphosphate glucokinase